jgi:hypothetical protein
MWVQLLVTITAPPVIGPAFVDIALGRVPRFDRGLTSGDTETKSHSGDATQLKAVYAALSLLCISLLAGMVGRSASEPLYYSALIVQGLACGAST